MKTLHHHSSAATNVQIRNRATRYLRLRDLAPRQRHLPIGRRAAREIVLKLSTTFPACTWAFIKMI